MPNRLPAMDDAPADAARVGRCSITLVHGTWGRGFFPKISELRRRYLFRGTKWWFEEGSQFRARLDKALNGASLDLPVRAFLWSGANSVHARDCAARELSNQLRKDLQHPYAEVVIIAHSHGGNVALRALQHLDSMADRVKVITLATPFLRVFARTSLQLPTVVELLIWMLIYFIIVVIVFKGAPLILPNGIAVSPPPILSPILLAGGVLALAWFSFVITRWFIAIFTNPRAASAIAEEAHYDTKGAAASRMLVIRGVDDEASLSLAAGSIGSRLSYLVLVGVIPLIVVISLIWGALHIPLPAVLRESALATVIMVTGVLGAGVFFILPGVFKSVFGREFLVSALVCDIAVDSVPDALDRVEAITLPPVKEVAPPETLWQIFLPFRQLRHGIYNHPDCVFEIVRWLRRVTKRKSN